MKAQWWGAVLWPAFLLACVLEMLVFGVVDPTELHLGRDGLAWSRQTVYTVAFFLFWALGIGAGALTLLLGNAPPAEAPPARD